MLVVWLIVLTTTAVVPGKTNPDYWDSFPDFVEGDFSFHGSIVLQPREHPQHPDGVGEEGAAGVGDGPGQAATLLVQAGNSLRRMKMISEEATKAAQEMEQLIYNLQLTFNGQVPPSKEDSDKLFPVTHKGIEPEVSTDSTDDVLPSEEAEVLPSEEAEDLPDPTDDVLPSGEDLPDPTDDVLPSEGDLPDPTEEFLPSEEAEDIPDPTEEVLPSEEAEDLPDPTEEVLPSEEDLPGPSTGQMQNCLYVFPEEQLPGIPESRCALWLVDNYHLYKDGWRTCSSAVNRDQLTELRSYVRERRNCVQYERACWIYTNTRTHDSDSACCAMVKCHILLASTSVDSGETVHDPTPAAEWQTVSEAEIFEPTPTTELDKASTGPFDDLATISCMDRPHHKLGNGCAKWMFDHYHYFEMGWRTCSSFDFTTLMRKGCGMLNKLCKKALRKGSPTANKVCCGSVYCYGSRRHMLKLG